MEATHHRQLFFFSSRKRHTSWNCDWSSDVCSSDLVALLDVAEPAECQHNDPGRNEDPAENAEWSHSASLECERWRHVACPAASSASIYIYLNGWISPHGRMRRAQAESNSPRALLAGAPEYPASDAGVRSPMLL